MIFLTVRAWSYLAIAARRSTAHFVHLKSFSKSARDFADFLDAQQRSGNAAQDLFYIANVGSYNREIARQGFFDEVGEPSESRAKNHRVGRTVVPWHYRGTQHRRL